MGVYDRAIETAARLIREKGEVCQWRVPGVSSPAEDTPWINTEPADTLSPASIVFLPSSNPLFQMMRGTEVISGKEYGLMAAQTFTPKVGDTVQRKDGSIFTILEATPLAPNGDVILWTLDFAK